MPLLPKLLETLLPTLGRARACRGFALAVALHLLCLTSLPVGAATRVWTGAAAAKNWSDPTNWGGTAPVTGDALLFPTAIPSTSRVMINDLPNVTFLSLRFEDLGYSIDGSTVRLSGGLVTAVVGSNGAGVAALIRTNLLLTGDQAFDVVLDRAVSIAFPSQIQMNGKTLTLRGGGEMLGINVTGTGALIVGDIRTSLNNCDSFVGPITMQDSSFGYLIPPSTLGTAAAPTFIRAGAILGVFPTTDSTLTEEVQLDGGGELSFDPGSVSTPMTMTLTGPLVIGGSGEARLACDNGPAAFTTHLSGQLRGVGQLKKVASAPLVIDGGSPNTFAGTFTVAVGEVSLAKPPGFNALSGIIVVDGSGSVLRFAGNEQLQDSSALAISDGGVADLGGNAETIRSLSVRDGTITGTSSALLTVTETISSTSSAAIDVGVRVVSAPTFLNVVSGSQNYSRAIIATPGATLRKTGPGIARVPQVTGGNLVDILAGKLVLGATDASPVTISSGATLGGTGPLGPVTAGSGGGVIDPGDGSFGPGSTATLACGNLVLNAASVYAPQLAGVSACDRISVTGTVQLGGATLAPVVLGRFSANLGDTLLILSNDGGEAISGTFAGLPQDAEVVAPGGARFRISYTAGSGNDVTLTVLELPTTGTTRTWTGLGTTNNMDEAANWDPVGAPEQGERLAFSGFAAPNRRTVTDNIPGFDFYDRLDFQGGTYRFGTAGIALKNGLSAVLGGAEMAEVTETILLTSSQTFQTDGGRLVLNQAQGTSVMLNGHTLTLLLTLPGGRIIFGDDALALGSSDGISGSGGAGNAVVQAGLGTVTMKCPNTYTGPTLISAGTFEAQNDGALGAFGPGNGTTVAPNTTLVLGLPPGVGGLAFFQEDVTLDGILISRPGFSTNRALGTWTFLQPDRVVLSEQGALEFGGVLQGAGGLQKTGTGTLTLNGAVSNTFSGRLLLSEGPLFLQKAGGAVAVPGDLVAQSGTTVTLQASHQIGGRVTLTNATLDLTSQTEQLTGLTLEGGTTVGGFLILESDLTVGGNLSGGAVVGSQIQTANASFNLAVNQTPAATDLTFTAPVSAALAGATIVRTGAGVVVFAQSTVPNLDLRGGVSFFNGNASASAIALNGGSLRGTGSVGSITSGANGGTVSTGIAGTTTGTLQSGSVSWNAATHFGVRLKTPTPGSGHDQLVVTGTVNLGGAILDASLLSGFAATAADTFVILQNDGGDPIAGTFAGLPENATLSVGGKTFRISYVGGTGNDVTLRLFQLGTGIVRVWTGGSATDSNWTTPANWSGGVAPSPGDDLDFALLGARRANTNNYPANTTFNSISVSGFGYSLSGAAVVLNDGLNFYFGNSSCLLSISLAQSQTFTAASGAVGTVNPAATVQNNGFLLTLHADTSTSRIVLSKLAGLGGTRKTGPGFATLSANTHSGFNDFLEGEVLLDTTATGLGAGGINVAETATLRLNAVPATTLTAALTLGGTLVLADSPVTFTGAVTLAGSDFGIIQVTGAGLPAFNTVVAGSGGLRKTGAGEFVLSGANPNTFTGGLLIEAGVVRAQKTAGSNVTPGPLTIGDGTATPAELRLINANQIPTIAVTLTGSGALLNTNGQAETVGTLLLTSGTISTSGAILNFSGTLNTFASVSPATINGNLTSTGSGVRFWTIEDGAAADDLIVNGAVNGPGTFVLVKSGEGRVAFAGNSNFPKLRLEYGTAAFTGTSTGVAVELGGFGGNQATLTGNGFTGVLSTPTVIGGNLAPSGILSTSGNATLNPETRFQVRLLNPTPGSGHDQLAVLGTPDLGGAQLQLAAQPGFVARFGDVYRIVDNNGSADPVAGTFAGLPEGALLDLPGLATFRISYVGGDGNDVTLTVTKALATGLVRTWDGGSGSDSNWTTAANWVGDVAPGPGDALVFPAGAARTSNNNDFPAGTTFDSIQFTGSGYSISGNQIVLNAGLRAEANIGAVSFGPPLLLSSAQTFFADVGAALTLLPGATLNVNGQALTLQDTVAVGLGAIDLQGVVSGPGSLRKTGSGTIFLRGNNTFTGSIDIQQGGLQIFHVNALGTTDAGTSIQPGAFLQLNSGGLTVAEPLSLAGTVLSTTSSNTLSGPITLPGPLAGTVQCTSPLTLSGSLSGPGALQKNGLADLTFAGLGANTFTGGFLLHEMNALLQKFPGVVALPGPVVVGDGLPPNELRLLNPNQIADNAVVTSNKGVLNLNSLAETIGGLVLTEATVQTGSATLALTGGVQCLAAANASTLNGQILLTGASGSVSTWSVEDGAAADDLLVSALVSSNNPALEKTGPGRARFSADNTLALLRARDGSTIVTGANDLTSIVLDGGTLGGTGRVAETLSATGGGTVAPGLSPGQLTSQGRVTWNAGTTFAIELNGTAPGTGHDRLNAAGDITLGGAKLAVSVGFTPALGAAFTVVRNTSGRPVVGTFAGLPEGAFLAVPGGFIFQITYVSGGNSITLTRVAGATPIITSTSVVPGVGAELGLNVVTVNATGTPGVPYQLETSLDLQTWTTSFEQQANVGSGVLQYRFTQSPGILKSFQRVRLP